MVVLSWPLWLDGDDFPRIPFVRGWDGLPLGWSWALLGSIGVAIGLAAIGIAWRPMLAVALGLMGVAIVGDQNRLQPWALQFEVVGIGLVAFPKPTALAMARWYAVALYLHSGLSKLDASFRSELGPTFLDAGLSMLGVSSRGWTAGAQTGAILAMPGIEVVVAVGLAVPSTRRFALFGAIGLHAALIAILGPWNLGHSTIVLAWNASMAVEDFWLFRAGPPPRLGLASRFLAVGFLVYPLGERFGIVDSWPAHALYASHAERSEVSLREVDADRFPPSVRRRLADSGNVPWRRLDLTNWSRDVRGVPFYPQARVANGVAEWLADRPGGPLPVRAIHRGRAAPWSTLRPTVDCLGLPAIRRRADRFAINSHPSSPAHP